MDIRYGLLAGAVACAVWHVAAGIMICGEMQRRGQKISVFWLRLMIPVYAHRYRKITQQETGRTAPLFYHWIVSINAALVATVAALLI
jgi:hypothetical protein